VDVHLHLTRWWPDLPLCRYRSDLDFTVRGLLAEMDANGIESGFVIDTSDTPTVKEGLAEGRATHSESRGRLRPVATVNPTRGEEEVRGAIEQWEQERDLVALKLFPGYQAFYPHDPRLDSMYEYAHRRNLPVMIHQGDTLDRHGLVKFTRPLEVDEVAVRYTDVRFVLCHFGNPWVEEAAEIVFKNENVYADTSGLLAHPSTPYFARMVEVCRKRLLNAILSVGSVERILYGSDWPLEGLDVAVDLVDRLDLPLDDREAILGGNARRLFRLPTRSS
jgi:hypothetical protein